MGITATFEALGTFLADAVTTTVVADTVGGAVVDAATLAEGFGGLGGIASLAMFLADGGPMQANRPYIVGERGPEIIYPEHNGYVVPNHLIPYTAFGEYRAAA